MPEHRHRPEITPAQVLTQPVTASDLKGGRVRIGISSGGKKFMPSSASRIDVVLRGRRLEGVRWDPKMGPDRERSGVLGVGRKPLEELVRVGERLVLRRGDAGVITLD